MYIHFISQLYTNNIDNFIKMELLMKLTEKIVHIDNVIVDYNVFL